MYGIFTYIYYKNQPNVGKYTIHGWYGFDILKQKCDGSMSMSYFICPESILSMDLLAARLGLSYSLMVSHHFAVICLLLCVLSMSMLSHSFVFVFSGDVLLSTLGFITMKNPPTGRKICLMIFQSPNSRKSKGSSIWFQEMLSLLVKQK